MTPDEAASELSTAFSVSPEPALAQSSGRFRSLVEWSVMRAVCGRIDRRTQRASKLDYRFDPTTNHLVAPKHPSMSVPLSSLRFDDGRLDHLCFGEVPLDDVVFEFASDHPDGWRALGYSVWSNTTILFYAGNGALFESLVVPLERGRVRDLEISAETGSQFVVGARVEEVVATQCTLSSGASVIEFRATNVTRSALGTDPTTILLRGGRPAELHLRQVHANPFQHPWEAKLT